MGKVPKKVLLGVVFVILSFSFMFVDALFHVDLNSRYAMVFMHVHGGGDHGEHGDVQSMLDEYELLELPTMGPEDAIERLPYTEVDGVKEFRLTVEDVRWEYAENQFVHVWAFNGQIPGPEIRVTEGDRVRVLVTNNLPTDTSVHWHGVDLENQADGVPGYTQYGIEPGETYVYEFTAPNQGTRWYHSHGSWDMDSVIQVDMGMSGAFIIEPREPTVTYDREYVLLLDEWAIREDYSNGALESLTLDGFSHGNHDYNVFTVNGLVNPYIPPLIVSEGETVLIRVINAGSDAMHPMHIHGHTFKVAATDGNPVPPDQQREYDTFTVHPAERADFVFTANNPGSWLFHCHHLHHAAAGMTFPLLYEDNEPCCLERNDPNE